MIVAVIAVVVSVLATAYTTYTAYQQQEMAAYEQSLAADLQAKYARAASEQEAADYRDASDQAERIAKVRREQVVEQARRMLNKQGSQAGMAGVVAFEGSLLENQLEAASLAEYNAQLAEMEPRMDAMRLRRGGQVAEFRGELSAGLNDFQSKLFRGRASESKTYGGYATIASGAAAGVSGAASFYTAGAFGGGGATRGYSG
ncbi:MAG: hypothetical protein ACREF4_15260, partial [Gammaproteobacteria bacterium]